MNDETKAALESLRREMADGDPDWWKRERLIFNYIDGEPARLAAALENLREACARNIEFERGDERGFHVALTATACIRIVERTPLDATPLADELDEAHRGEREAWRQVDEVRTERDALRAERDRLRTWVSTVSEALGAIEPVSDCRVELGADAAASVAAALRARVADLEECKQEGDDVAVAAQRLRFWEENPYACPVHFGARTACGQCYDSERALRLAAEAQVAEAHERLDEFGMRRDGTTATLVEGIAAMRTRIDEYRADWYRAEAQVAAARAECASIIKYTEDDGRHSAATDILEAMDEAAK